jgi:folate-binding protein YgfZ
MKALDNRTTTWAGTRVVVVARDDLGVPGFDLMIDGSQATALADALRAAGAIDVHAAVTEVRRVEAGRPLFHKDMDEETIPLEAGIEDRAISFTKGCYVGQEIIVRVLQRGGGRVARKLVGLTLDRDAPPGTPLVANDRETGRLTSVVQSRALGRVIALGYVGRDLAEPGARVDVSGGGSAVVTKLPFVQGV